MTSNKLLLIAISFIFLSQASCRKEKLKAEPEKLLVGNWYLYISCGGPVGCSIINDDEITLDIEKKGFIKFINKQYDIEDYARITSLKEVADPMNQAPQVSYLFEVQFKRKDIFHKLDELSKYKYLRYMNGYFNASGNFISLEMVKLAQIAEADIPSDRFFIRK